MVNNILIYFCLNIQKWLTNIIKKKTKISFKKKHGKGTKIFLKKKKKKIVSIIGVQIEEEKT